jgi:hypothetical protein
MKNIFCLNLLHFSEKLDKVGTDMTPAPDPSPFSQFEKCSAPPAQAYHRSYI